MRRHIRPRWTILRAPLRLSPAQAAALRHCVFRERLGGALRPRRGVGSWSALNAWRWAGGFHSEMAGHAHQHIGRCPKRRVLLCIDTYASSRWV